MAWLHEVDRSSSVRVEGFGFVDVSAALSRSSRTELLLLLGAIIFDGSAARNRSSHRVFLLRFISGIAFLQLCRVTALVQLCRVTAVVTSALTVETYYFAIVSLN